MNQNSNLEINNGQFQPTNPIQNNLALNYLMYIVSVLLKPFQTFKEEENKLKDTKNSLILSMIIAGGMMLISLFKAMINAVIVKRMDYSTFTFKTSIEFSNLKNLDYLSLIGKNLLIYSGVILAIATIYYLASLVIKKEINFIKLLSITSTSIIPFVILGMVASPVLGKIWTPLSIIILIIGIVYSILIFIYLIKEDINFLKKDNEIYFHLVCLSILGSAGYYLCIKLLTSGVTDQISDYLELFS